jgi:dUTP pyrophosphatase
VFEKMAITIPCKVSDGSTVPEYRTAGSAGADICAFLESPVTIAPGERKLITTGVYVEIPEGYEIQVRPRSGLALKHGVTVLNSPGTIDSDYRGEIGIVLINHGSEPFTVANGDRIAQLVVSAVTVCSFERVDSLGLTERGSGGYGSTGR